MRPKRLIKRAARAAQYEIHAVHRRGEVRERTVLYESFAGNGVLGNPEAIFRALLAAPGFADLEHVWALANPREHRAVLDEFADVENVRFVTRGSSAYLKALATSRYLVNNATFPPYFQKRPGQVYLNTWHGTPLKRMGFDMPDGAHESANTLRNFVSADYLLSASPFMSETMYGDAYKLRNLYRGEVVEEGYPRIDRGFLEPGADDGVRAELERAGCAIGGRRIVVFAPTWRGASFSRPLDNLDEILRQREALASGLDPERWCVLLKLHQAAHRYAAARPDLAPVLVPNRIPTNRVLGAADMLVTDYSSIFFDFLPLRRPILFFTPDGDDYEGGRGTYLPREELPGPVADTPEEAARLLAGFAAGWSPDAAYEKAVAAYCPWEDGRATERVVDVVFRGLREGRRVRRLVGGAVRPSVLFYLGGMRPNGITSSAVNLINNIDHDRVDVSVFYKAGPAARRILKERPLPDAVRHFPRVGGMNGSKAAQLRRRLHFRLGRYRAHESPGDGELWDAEWLRCFGDSRFDTVVDFSGYSPFWATLLLHTPDRPHRVIWLHNDMVSDAAREVGGRHPHARSLAAVFELYRDYDRLVSVSPALEKVNRAGLARYVEPSRFCSAPNCIAGERIRALSLEPPTEDDPDPLAERGWGHDPAHPTFVCVGRLSTEKNHARLLDAFAAVHALEPAARLVIVGGGPLEDALRARIARLGLEDSVLLTGQCGNPFRVLRAADCFVLSSDYEGQPMVLLEAAVLGLPVVTVEFATVADALPAGTGLRVPQSVEGLASGLRAYLAGEVPAPAFDDAAYNEQALQRVYEALALPRVEQGHRS